jgi:hypothetical protein
VGPRYFPGGIALRDALDDGDLIAELVMTRSAFHGTLMPLEGATDSRLFEKFVDAGKCRIVPGHGRQSVIEAVVELGYRGHRGIVAVVDADRWHLEGRGSPSPNIIPTKTSDIELVILSSPALNRVRNELLSDAKVKNFVARRGKASLLEVLLEIAYPAGILRWISHRDGLNLKFQGIDYASFLSPTSLELDRTRFVRRVLQQTGNPNLTAERVLKDLEVTEKEGLPASQVCCGHDVVAVLAAGMRRALGSHRVGECDPSYLEKILRLAFEMRDFQSTHLYADLRRWEMENAPFRIFAD